MSLLKVRDLSHCFMDKNLYNNSNFDLFKGEHIGLVGQNGAGKSTLMKILLGDVIPDDGYIKWQSNIEIGHLDQHAEIDKEITIRSYLKGAFENLYSIERNMDNLYKESALSSDERLLIKASEYQELLILNDFYSIDSKISKITNGFGIDAIGIDKLIGELSGGQRGKVILAKLLLSNPDILLLDEPTNFLDKEHVEWLSEYLSKFEGAFIVISHDFDFLEKITTGICDIEFGTIKKYSGKYSEFLKQKDHSREEYIRRYNSQQKKIEKAEDFIRKNKAGVNSKIARGRQKQLDKVNRIAPPSFTDKIDIKFKEVETASQLILEVKNLEVGYYYSILPRLNFKIENGEKVVITGFNGIGKSTLVKTLVSEIPKIYGEFRFGERVRTRYYEQELTWDNPNLTPLQIISSEYPNLTNKEIRKQLSKCALKEEHVTRVISSLSGGEQSKVKLCLITLSPCNLLILDEPTNHFDKETKESLKNALINFKGSIILVSHEESFYRDWIDKVVSIEKYFD